ncbi:MAG: hypothetical protein HN368_11295 [Spirochaetales bacterium]|nr:hypothetical protein [Spirochaetales bacterium]
MKNQSVFQELSRYIPEKEREDLLKRLQKSIYVPEEAEEKKFHREIDRNEREEHLTRDINNLSWISRIILWFRGRIGGKSIRELYLSVRIKNLKKHIGGKYPGLTGFETRDLSPKLAEEIFSVYTRTIPLRDIYQKIWMKSEEFERMFMSLLELRIPHVCSTLEDFMAIEKLQRLFSDAGKKEVLKEEIGKKLEAYIESIPNGIFKELEKDLLPITCSKDLVLYQFKAFFQLFHFTPLEEDLGKKTYFKNASAMLCLQHMERLHYALNETLIFKDGVELPEDILGYLTKVKKRKEIESSEEFENSLLDDDVEPEEIDEEELIEEEVIPDTAIAEELKRLFTKAISVYRSVPLEQLIRYFMKDPYYELVKGIPELRLKDLYVSVLRMRVFAELEKVFPEIRKQVIETEIKLLFEGKNLRNFRNYREYQSIDYQKLGLPYFKFTRSILLLYNYVFYFYKDYLREGIQVLERGVLSQNRITRDRLLQYAAAVEDIEGKATAFDYALSPDAEDGKLFQRLRFSLAQDKSHQRMYRTLVIQKDREVKALLDRGIEGLTGLRNVYDEIVSSTSETLRLQMGNHYYIKGKPVPLQEILEERSNQIKRFVDLLNQVLKLETG